MEHSLFIQAQDLADRKQWPAAKKILRDGIEGMTPEDRNQILEGDPETLKQWAFLMTRARVNQSYESDPPAIRDFYIAVKAKVLNAIPNFCSGEPGPMELIIF
ncbi:MAG: hypothetical protein HQK58_16770 [Deltaproteobacteria bacterium]|nr:hypothetical protein [Deltaproteobacteria bacterium]